MPKEVDVSLNSVDGRKHHTHSKKRSQEANKKAMFELFALKIILISIDFFCQRVL